jgi:hypothetical protein
MNGRSTTFLAQVGNEEVKMLFDMLKGEAQKIDALLNHPIRRYRRERYLNGWLKPLNTRLDHRIIAYYGHSSASFLSELCQKYGSDKGAISKSGHPYPWAPHTYADYYSRLFDHCRTNIKKVFECGLGTNNINITANMGFFGKPGASLRVWRDYFPNAAILGADIDKEILFNEERINTFYVDQTDPVSIAELWSNINVDNFDFMVDDGLHTFEAGVCLFESSVSRLANQGIYVIEDVNFPDLTRYATFFENKAFQVDYVIMLDSNFHLHGMVVIRKNLN